MLWYKISLEYTMRSSTKSTYGEIGVSIVLGSFGLVFYISLSNSRRRMIATTVATSEYTFTIRAFVTFQFPIGVAQSSYLVRYLGR